MPPYPRGRTIRFSATPGMGHRMASIRPPGTVRVQSIGPESAPPSRRKVAGETCADAAQLTPVTGSGHSCIQALRFQRPSPME